MLSGAGETSCGNTRCTHHDVKLPMPSLSTLELPFVYEERGETKSALVKMVLCERCVKKLMWKRQKEKEQGAVSSDSGEGSKDAGRGQTSQKRRRVEDDSNDQDQVGRKALVGYPHGVPRHSRSRSPPPLEARSRRPKPS